MRADCPVEIGRGVLKVGQEGYPVSPEFPAITPKKKIWWKFMFYVLCFFNPKNKRMERMEKSRLDWGGGDVRKSGRCA